MSQKNSGNVSIANVLALIGLAGIGVVTFLGMLLHSSDGKPIGAILGALALVVGLGAILFVAIKAKGAADNADKWRFVEWGALCAYVVVALVFSASFLRFFYVLSEKESLQGMARSEIQSICGLYQNYDSQQKMHLNNAVEQVQSYIASRQKASVDSALAAYVSGIGRNVDSWAEKASALTRLAADAELDGIEKRINGWEILKLSSTAAELEEKDSKAWEMVEAKIRKNRDEHRLIPVISGGGQKPYRLNGYAQFDLGTRPEARFAETLRTASGNTAMGWIVYVVLNILVLFNYVVAQRSRVVRGGRGGGSDTIGQVL